MIQWHGALVEWMLENMESGVAINNGLLDDEKAHSQKLGGIGPSVAVYVQCLSKEISEHRRQLFWVVDLGCAISCNQEEGPQRILVLAEECHVSPNE